MRGTHAETYVVEVDRKAGVTTIEIQPNEGSWYDEQFTVIERTTEVAEVGGVIASDFEARASATDANWE